MIKFKIHSTFKLVSNFEITELQNTIQSIIILSRDAGELLSYSSSNLWGQPELITYDQSNLIIEGKV